jgi:hypothetical protein
MNAAENISGERLGRKHCCLPLESEQAETVRHRCREQVDRNRYCMGDCYFEPRAKVTINLGLHTGIVHYIAACSRIIS